MRAQGDVPEIKGVLCSSVLVLCRVISFLKLSDHHLNRCFKGAELKSHSRPLLVKVTPVNKCVFVLVQDHVNSVVKASQIWMNWSHLVPENRVQLLLTVLLQALKQLDQTVRSEDFWSS